jgi:hypothetical protein
MCASTKKCFLSSPVFKPRLENLDSDEKDALLALIYLQITNKCSIEMFIKLVLTLFFKRQQHCKLSWLDKDSDKDQSRFDKLFN